MISKQRSIVISFKIKPLLSIITNFLRMFDENYFSYWNLISIVFIQNVLLSTGKIDKLHIVDFATRLSRLKCCNNNFDSCLNRECLFKTYKALLALFQILISYFFVDFLIISPLCNENKFCVTHQIGLTTKSTCLTMIFD